MSSTDLTARVLADIDGIAASNEGGKFWGALGERHRALIANHGFANFKRTVNFHYGQWAVTKFRSVFIKNLLIDLVSHGQLPVGLAARCDMNDVDGIVWPGDDTVSPVDAHKLRAYAAFCGMIWQHAKRRDVIGCLNVPEPALGHPMPVTLKGQPISQDLAQSSLDLNFMASVIDMSKARRVLEIGAGYGRLAYMIKTKYPQIEYTVADIPPAMAVSQNYLASLFGDAKVARCGEGQATREFNFILPHELDAYAPGHFDVVINVSSFDEMPAAISTRYVATIDRLCAGHLYVNGYARMSQFGDRLGLDELTYPSSWGRPLDRKHAIFPGWVEKVFAVGKAS